MQNKLIFLLLTFCLFFVSCKKQTEVAGDVFIVESTGSHKLSLAEIKVVPEEDFMAFVNERKVQREESASKWRSSFDACFNTDPRFTNPSKTEHCLLQADEILSRIGESYFSGIFSPFESATSNADGKFNLKIPKTGKYYIAAHGQRKIKLQYPSDSLDSEPTKEYYWFVPLRVNGEPQTIVLSNNNLYEPRGAQF